MHDRAAPVASTLAFGAGGWCYLVDLPLAELVPAQRWLAEQVGDSGLFPVIVEESVAFVHAYDDLQEGTTPEILASAAALDVDAVVAKFREWGEGTLDHWRRTSDDLTPDDDGFWLTDEGETRIPLGDPCLLALFPVRRASEVFAQIGWHAFNSIEAPEHVTMMRYFEETFGMELVSISGDGYGLVMTEPVRDREVAVDLATVLIGYAHTQAPHGSRGTFSELASYLLVGRILRLWWD
jgi:hypothetical protein